MSHKIIAIYYKNDVGMRKNMIIEEGIMIKRRSLIKLINILLVLGVMAQVYSLKSQAAETSRVLVWSDEFKGSEIDKDKWSVATDNIYVENGCAVLPVSYQKDKGEWNQAWLSTQGSFGFKYGRLEARIKMTAYPGEFPAFWTMGYNKQSEGADSDIDGCRWSKCGEIDIMEEGSANGVSAEPFASLHWCDNWLNRNKSQKIGKMSFDTRQWHIYAMEWDEQGIEVFYDGISAGKIDYCDKDYYNDMNPFSMPQFIIFDNLINDKSLADNNVTPKMWIDWVRVYAPQGTIKPVNETSISLEETGKRKAINNGRIAVGDSAYMDVVFEPENVVNQSYKLVSADENIIHVNGGVLTAVSPGRTKVTAISPQGNIDVMNLEVYYDTAKKDLSNIKLENASDILKQQDIWYWGEYGRDLNMQSQKIYTGLIKVAPNTTYELAVSNECMSTKLNVIEYKDDGTYIKWADYGKNNILRTGSDAAYIRLNLTLTKSGITMNYGDYMEYIKYSDFMISKK